MVKANLSFGGKLLLIILTIVIYTLVVVGAIAGIGYYAYKKVKVRDIAEMLHAEQWIAEDYTGTIETLVKDILSKFGSGELTLNDLFTVSPALEEKADGLVANIENIGLFKVDTDVLYSTPVSGITSNFANTVVVTASMRSLSSTFGFDLPNVGMISGSEENPVYFYTAANSQNEDGSFTEIGKAFALSDGAYSYLTRTEAYFSTYTSGEDTLPVVQSVTKKLYTLSGVTVQDRQLYDAQGRRLYIGTTTGEDGSSSTVYTRLTTNNDAVQTIPEEGSETPFTFALRENEWLYFVSGPAEDPESDTFVYERVGDLTDTQKTVLTREIAARYKYTPLYAKISEGEYVLATAVDENNEYVIDADNGGYAIDEKYQNETELYYLDYTDGEALTLEDAQEAAKTQLVYVKTNGIADLPLTEAMDSLSAVLDMNSMTLADFERYFGVELSTNAVLEHVLYVPLGRFGSALNEEIENVAIKDVLTITADSPYALIRLAYGNGFATDENGNVMTDENGNIVVTDESEIRTIGDLSAGFDDLTISDFVEIEEPDENGEGGSAKLLLAIKDWTLNDLSSSDKIDSLSLGDLIDITDDSAKILTALKDVAIGNIAETIDDLSLNDILEIDDSDALLSNLKNSTLSTLADDISELSVQALFSDGMYEQGSAGTVTAPDGIDSMNEDALKEYVVQEFEKLSAVYGKDNLYLYGNGGYVAYTSYSAKELASLLRADGSIPVYSPYTAVYEPNGANELSDYANVPLYYLEKVTTTGEDGTESVTYKMSAATGTTAWKIPTTTDEGGTETPALPAGTKLYAPNEKGGYTLAEADEHGYYSQKTLWYYDTASEGMKSISLAPAAYGILPALLGTDGAPTIALFAKLTPAAEYTYTDPSSQTTYYTTGNLFWYDTANEKWVQATATAARDDDGALLKDTNGNVLYTVEGADGKTLYTYGRVIGTWKYLLLEDGAERPCTVQNVGSLVTNVSANIKTATIRALYEDGLIGISAVTIGDVTYSPSQMMEIRFKIRNAEGTEETTEAFGDMTLGRFIEVAFMGLASNVVVG